MVALYSAVEVLLAIVWSSLARGLVLMVVKVQYGLALTPIGHITLALWKFRELGMNFPLFCRLNRINKDRLGINADVGLSFDWIFILIIFIGLQDELGVQIYGLFISTTALAWSVSKYRPMK